jgi:uncharacterized membrane protein YtjA (UPF0391 family)
MLSWALTFLVIALVAAFFGLGGVAALSMDIAHLLFVVFFILLIVAIIGGGIRRASRGQTP